MKSSLLPGHRKEPGLCGWGQPAVRRSFLFVEKGFCTKTISLGLFSWKEEPPPEGCGHLMTSFQNELSSVSKQAAALESVQNHSEMERLAWSSTKRYLQGTVGRLRLWEAWTWTWVLTMISSLCKAHAFLIWSLEKNFLRLSNCISLLSCSTSWVPRTAF